MSKKRPTCVSKETYTCVSVKRDLLMCQKRPTHASKESYQCVKRDLFKCVLPKILHLTPGQSRVWVRAKGVEAAELEGRGGRLEEEEEEEEEEVLEKNE